MKQNIYTIKGTPITQGNITVSGLNSNGTLNLSSILGQTIGNVYRENESKNVRKYEVYETSEDVLALSCAWYRLRTDSKKGEKVNVYRSVTSLLSDQLFDYIEEQDRLLANEIRNYYSKKLMVLNLKDQKLTPFRQDLNELLHGEAKKNIFVEKMLPLVYRLPEFYFSDVEFDKIKINFKKEIPNYVRTVSGIETKTLYPVASHFKNNKRIKTYEYWFKDDDDYAHRFCVKPDNPLLGLWNQIFNQPQLRLNFYYACARRDDLEFYNLANVTTS